jgi:hypothetical protein
MQVVVETLASLALDNHGHGADSAIAPLLMSMVRKKNNMDSTFEQAKTKKYNNWGERGPLVCGDKSKIFEAQRYSSRQDLSIPEKSILYFHKLTDIKGFEFVAFSNAHFSRPIRLPNNVLLFPCFCIKLDDINLSDPKAQATIKMENSEKYIYDGWLPIEILTEESIRENLRMLNESMSVFSIVSGSRIKWEPKYIAGNVKNSIHYLTPNHLSSIAEISNLAAKMKKEDRKSVFRSISWLDQSNKVSDEKAKFLFSILAIESLCSYIEKEAEEDSDLTKLRFDTLSKPERKKQRNNCINEIIENEFEQDPSKAISKAYFDCVVGIKKGLQNHLRGIFGDEDKGLKLFFESSDSNPSLYEIRHLIAHGAHDSIDKNDNIRIISNVYNIQKFATRYIWKVLNLCYGIFNTEKQVKARMNINLNDFIIPKLSMYQGPVDMALLYTK